ncbi:MAG: type II toxin-antitoxin system VapC family toxin [Gammaproteobacteria bacterium]|jgi:predicted nucleic acid-binding protein|nr:type II toxin-antitoxin system VapC family toxin [Gammaproteobacteria bacterium]MBP6050285.1 type II toxin-antitoxin system VapC family toxin [Pseudomonadales bacterium]MBK6583796.1 type II toxin-antitoxin system VapC family toxin [Gammaproteobacteria bacterium]MBK7171160.1 type II toxin-antitoxin system VapC family toxin [Gammaproteobacteria bacterium]MBK7522133.1 type II toxin-antitoxin system VapC family toxin [Gammaproteobacteria bacterium]
MTSFVLDNSVAMRWLLASDKATDQRYAEAVLRSMTTAEAVVPNLWHLEAANVLLGACLRENVEIGEIERFTAQLENLRITVDALTANQVFGHTIALALAYRLSSYDAAYLELALREGLPLATLDKDLRRAARKSDVTIYLR